MENQKIHNVNKPRVEVACEVCGTIICVPPCLANKRFCSVKCKCKGTRKIKDESLRQCNKCKKILPIITEFYEGKHEYRCKECCRQRTKDTNRTLDGRFRSAQHIAKRRKQEWSIDKNQYSDFIQRPCHYCGESLNETGTGLDRKNNINGYIYENVVSCCNRCNTTRSDNFSYEEMLILSETIKTIVSSRKPD